MDKFEAMKVVQDRILELESEQIAKKVTGYLYFRYEEPEIIRLAFGPDILIQNLILKAKVSLPSEAIISPPISPSVNPISIPDPSLQHACFQSPSPLRRSLPPPLDGASHGEFQQTELMKLEDQFEPVNSVASGFSDNFCNEGGVSNISVRHNPHVPNSPEVPIKTCRYFKKGVCKNGNKCRYSHSNKFGYEDQVVTPGSLELLEMEITELLKSIGGSPLSISSLPMLYFERYRRTLKVEGYYPGTNLVKLLARLNNTLKLIYRPDGQHAIMLAEDSGKNLEVRATKSDPGPVNGSRNLFLTFRPESTFTKEDVSKYFSTFGTVQDVRIPCQQKRMFGFVTFASSDTVAVVLAKGNPHLVCGSRVIVKPWKEKPRICERTYDEKLGSVLYSSNHMDNNSEHQSRLHEEQLIEEHKKMLELKMRHLSYMNLSQRQQSPNCDQPYFGRAIQEPRVSKDHNKFPSEQFGCMLNGGRTTDSHHAKINYTYPHSNQEFDYPGNPFA